MKSANILKMATMLSSCKKQTAEDIPLGLGDCPCSEQLQAYQWDVTSIKASESLKDRVVCTKDDETFHVHSVLLSSLSESILKTFSEKYTNINAVVTFDMDSSEFKVLEQLAYTGHCDVHEENLASLAATARNFAVPALSNICGRSLLDCLNIHNCVHLFRIASKNLCHHVTEKVLYFIKVNFSDLILQEVATVIFVSNFVQIFNCKDALHGLYQYFVFVIIEILKAPIET